MYRTLRKFSDVDLKAGHENPLNEKLGGLEAHM